jgi:hypothetical protein
MKKHLVCIWYETPSGKRYCYRGYITERIENNKAVVYPISLFRQAFGFDLPDYSNITYD